MKKPLVAMASAFLLVLLTVLVDLQVDAQKPSSELPPLHAGIDSPGAIPAPQPENPVFFFEGKVDWPLLELSEPRTAWEYAQRGMYRQDDLEDDDAALQDFEHAEQLLEEIAGRLDDPTLPERFRILHYRLGGLYQKKGLYERAIEEFEILLRENPETEGAHLHIAEAYADLGEFEKARDHFEAELQVSPRNQKANFELGLFLLRPDLGLEEPEQEALARNHLERYLQEAERHCDTYPHKILKADQLVRQLGGEGSSAAVDRCVPATAGVYR